MPPKGWRKTADGFKPTNSSGAPLVDRKKHGLEDLLLPRTLITRLAREALPDNSTLPKDGITALMRSATVFTSYITAEANKQAELAGRKTITPSDITRALEICDFGAFASVVVKMAEEMVQKKPREKLSDNASGHAEVEDADDEDAATVADVVAGEEDIEEDVEPETLEHTAGQSSKKAKYAFKQMMVTTVDPNAPASSEPPSDAMQTD